MRLVVLVATGLLLAPGTVADVQKLSVSTATVIAPAVASLSEDAVLINVTAEVFSPGFGRVFVEASGHVEEEVEWSAQIASRVAARQLSVDPTGFDAIITIESGNHSIEGTSAGLAISVATARSLAQLQGEANLSAARFALTGSVLSDGSVGPVAGLDAKANGVQEAGLSYFFHPRHEIQPAACQNGSLQCIPVGSVAAVLDFFNGNPAPESHRVPLPSLPNRVVDFAQRAVFESAQEVEQARNVSDSLSPRDKAVILEAIEEAEVHRNASIQAFQAERQGAAVASARRALQYGLEAAGQAEVLAQQAGQTRQASFSARCENATLAVSSKVGLGQPSLMKGLAGYESHVAQRHQRQAQTILKGMDEDSVQAIGNLANCVAGAEWSLAWLQEAQNVTPSQTSMAWAGAAARALDDATIAVAYGDAATSGTTGGARSLLEAAIRHAETGEFDVAIVMAAYASAISQTPLLPASDHDPMEALLAESAARTHRLALGGELDEDPVLGMLVDRARQPQPGQDEIRSALAAHAIVSPFQELQPRRGEPSDHESPPQTPSGAPTNSIPAEGALTAAWAIAAVLALRRNRPERH